MPGTVERVLQLVLCCVVVAARPGNPSLLLHACLLVNTAVFDKSAHNHVVYFR
jgi:hypothetical protein